MDLIDLDRLERDLNDVRDDFQQRRPFRWTTLEGFFKPDAAMAILGAYPTIEQGKWDGTTYIDQKNKFTTTSFEQGGVLERAFEELNGRPFREWLQRVTGILDIEGDPTLFGGGLHQSTTGAFLNVHVDYNYHPVTQHHRRLNVLVYMNPQWRDEYGGHLELWDLTGREKRLVARVAPTFNRMLVFETNEISFHGHPRPLTTPPGVTRKSLAVYYYTATRPGHEVVAGHNTVYVNTEGTGGQLKRFSSGVKAFLERINKR